MASNDAAHAEGYVTSATGLASHAEGGDTVADASFAHASGRGGTNRGINNSFAQGGGPSGGALGACQYLRAVLRTLILHDDAAWHTINVDNGDDISVPANTLMSFDGHITGLNNGRTKRWVYRFDGVVSRDGADNTVLLDSNVTTVYEADDVSFDMQVAVDDANEYLLLQVKDADGVAETELVFWVGTLFITENSWNP